MLLNVLIPFKRFLGELPWLGVTALLAFAGYRLGGARLAVSDGGVWRCSSPPPASGKRR